MPPFILEPVIVATRAGLSIERRATDWGAFYTVQTPEGAALYRSNRRESASAWLEGYEAGKAASGLAG